MFLHHKHRINLYYEVHLIIDTSDWLGLSVFKTFWIEYHDVFAILFSILTTNTIIYMHYKHKYVWTLNSDILNFIEHRDVTHNFESVPTKDHFSSIKFLSRRFQCDHYQNMHNLNKLTERKKINRKPEMTFSRAMQIFSHLNSQFKYLYINYVGCFTFNGFPCHGNK
jgi:hypothetical protein